MDDQAFSLSHDLAPSRPPHLSPVSKFKLSLSHTSRVLPADLTDLLMVGEMSENLVLYKSFNTFWGEVWRRAGGSPDFL